MSQSFSLNKRIIEVSIPLVLNAFLMLMLQTGQTAIIGHAKDVSNLFLLSVLQPVVFLFIALIEALEITNQVYSAKSFGAGKLQNILPATLTAIGIGVISVAMLIILGQCFAAPTASLFQISDINTFGQLLLWLSISYIPMVMNAVVHSALRGVGKTRLSLGIVIVSTLINLAMVYFLGHNLGFGVMSIPISNMVSSTTALLLGTTFVIRVLRPASIGTIFRVPPSYFAFLSEVGLPIFITIVSVFASSFVINALIAPLGPEVISAYFVSGRLQSLFLVPAIAFASGISIIMNQSMGARDLSVTKSALVTGGMIVVTSYVLVSFLVVIFRTEIASLLTSEEHIRGLTSQLLQFVAPTFVCLGPSVALLTIMEQVGRAARALVINLLTTGLLIAAIAITLKSNPSTLYFFMLLTIGNLFNFIVAFNEFRLLKRWFDSKATKNFPSAS